MAESGGGLNFAAIREKVGGEGMDVRNALRGLRGKGWIENNPHTKLWCLTEKGLQSDTYQELCRERQAREVW